MRVTLVRHTALDIPSHICYGQSEVVVASSFESEVSALLRKLKETKFDAVYSSPLQRCYQLARVLSSTGELQIISRAIRQDYRLKELHFGDWEMKSWDAIPRGELDRWSYDYADTSPPNGETFTQLHARVTEFLKDVSGHHLGGELLVVTHGGPIRALVAEILGLPVMKLFRIAIDHGSVTRIEFNDEVPRVLCINA